MRSVLFFLSIIQVFGSCNNGIENRVSSPDDLIPKDSMVVILKELVVMESYVQGKYVHVSQFKKIMTKSGENILKGYDVSNQRFERSMDYYGSRHREMIEIYTKVLDELQVEAAILSEKLPKMDSTNQLSQPGFLHIPVD